jgi:hypothetical protein
MSTWSACHLAVTGDSASCQPEYHVRTSLCRLPRFAGMRRPQGTGLFRGASSRALSSWSQAVRLIGAVVVDETSALLLEACERGTARSQALPPLEQDAIEGRGVFRRFRDAVHEEGIADQWYAFSVPGRGHLRFSGESDCPPEGTNIRELPSPSRNGGSRVSVCSGSSPVCCQRRDWPESSQRWYAAAGAVVATRRWGRGWTSPRGEPTVG